MMHRESQLERESAEVEAASGNAEELAKLRRELWAATAKFDALFNQSGIFAGILDLQGKVLDVNNLAVDACGYTKEQVLNKPFWDTLWWRGSEEMKARIRFATHQAASGDVFREELRYWVADGSERCVDFAIHPIRDQTGAVMFLHPTGIDITERKQIENALHNSEQKSRWLAAIVESSDDAIISKNLDGIITSWNRGAERIFGFAAEEVIGQPITIVIPHDRLDEERVILARIRKGEPIDHFETIRQRKDGSLIAVSLTVSPVKNAVGTIVGASKSARDITKQKQAQDQIATLAREAEHRSKNLLATVQATVHLSTAETPEGLKRAIEGRILALANVHSLFVETRWIGAELSAIVRQELAPYCAKDEKLVRIEGPPVLLEPNAAQAVAVALHELATNAAKYGALSVRDGHISLRWMHEADGLLILIWRELGGPVVHMPTHKGFGTRVIERMIDQLKGKARFDWRVDGLVCEISFDA
jgi:PAS domain S-box-containing protein